MSKIKLFLCLTMLPKFISFVRNKEEVEGTRYIRSSASPLYSVYLACHSDSSFVRPTGQLLTINDSARSRRWLLLSAHRSGAHILWNSLRINFNDRCCRTITTINGWVVGRLATQSAIQWQEKGFMWFVITGRLMMIIIITIIMGRRGSVAKL